ncbi:hypothetical protein [Terriglobus sp. RCC_193]|uniref:hypothetical protein n=1 Tax=Terriglobus sp. RCC_193 TaxID=3239218 RepID=UPI0035249121
MNSTMHTINAETMAAPEPVIIDVAKGPTPEQTDIILRSYQFAAEAKTSATKEEKDAKDRVIILVKGWGQFAAGSEHSRIIEGALNTAMVTDVTTTSLDEEKINNLRFLLLEHDRADLFSRIFSERIKHELVAGAEEVFRTADLPKHLRTKLKAAFAECIKVSSSAPRVKVSLREKEAKQRKPRAKKAVAA